MIDLYSPEFMRPLDEAAHLGWWPTAIERPLPTSFALSKNLRNGWWKHSTGLLVSLVVMRMDDGLPGFTVGVNHEDKGKLSVRVREIVEVSFPIFADSNLIHLDFKKPPGDFKWVDRYWCVSPINTLHALFVPKKVEAKA